MKTYVISDVHGLWTNFSKFLEMINEDDLVYVLGDVIDRGPEGMRILRTIMDRPHQLKMILGNHEYMMLEFLKCSRSISDKGWRASSYEYKQRSKCYTQWAVYNQGAPTLTDYERLSAKDQDKVYEFLCNLPVALTNVQVEDQTFYLVHACPQRCDQDVVYQTELEGKQIHGYVWERPYFPEMCHVSGKITVTGHTIVRHYHDSMEVFFSKDENGNVRYIDIDCGCALGSKNGRLACLCLNDLSVTYF